MKVFFILYLSIFINSIFSEVQWIQSIEKAVELAKAKNAPILVDLYTDWCAYCKVLEKEVFPSPDVDKELEFFVTVRLNADEFPNLTRYYGVTGYPTILFLDKNKTLLDKISGLPSPKKLISVMKNAYENRDIEGKLLEKLKTNPTSLVVNFKLGVYYYNLDNKKHAKNYFKTAYDSPDPEIETQKHDSLYNLGIIDIEEDDFKSAIENWTKYIKDYQKKREMGSAFYYRGLSYVQLKKKKEGKKDLEKALELMEDESEKTKVRELLIGL